jgi:hypothetical protein
LPAAAEQLIREAEIAQLVEESVALLHAPLELIESISGGRRALAYNDVHCSGSLANREQDTRCLQPAYSMSTVSGWSLHRFGGGQTS